MLLNRLRRFVWFLLVSCFLAFLLVLTAATSCINWAVDTWGRFSDATVALIYRRKYVDEVEMQALTAGAVGTHVKSKKRHQHARKQTPAEVKTREVKEQHDELSNISPEHAVEQALRPFLGALESQKGYSALLPSFDGCNPLRMQVRALGHASLPFA